MSEGSRQREFAFGRSMRHEPRGRRLPRGTPQASVPTGPLPLSVVGQECLPRAAEPPSSLRFWFRPERLAPVDQRGNRPARVVGAPLRAHPRSETDPAGNVRIGAVPQQQFDHLRAVPLCSEAERGFVYHPFVMCIDVGSVLQQPLRNRAVPQLRSVVKGRMAHRAKGTDWRAVPCGAPPAICRGYRP